MGEVTGIGWTDHTWSPWWGCTKVSVGDKGACVGCYAEALDKRVGGDHWGVGKPRRAMSEAHWREPLKWDRNAAAAGEPRFVFPSMCDPFDKEVDPAWRRRFFDLIRATPHLTWLLLTKRPPNIVDQCNEAGGLPANAALGATMVTQKEYDRDYRTMMDAADELRPAFTFASLEPLMEAIDLSLSYSRSPGMPPKNLSWLDWVIVGGESGPRPRPMSPDWASSLRDQCAEAGVPFFFKQWGGLRPKSQGKSLDGREHCDRPALEAA
jgi:protein gp37